MRREASAHRRKRRLRLAASRRRRRSLAPTRRGGRRYSRPVLASPPRFAARRAGMARTLGRWWGRWWGLSAIVLVLLAVPVAAQQQQQQDPFGGQFGAMQLAPPAPEAARLTRMMGDALGNLQPQ